MARRKRGNSDQPIGVGLTAKQMKRRKPISSDFLVDIDPLTDNQKRLFESYEQGKHLVAYGCAGTGKTFITLYNALMDRKITDAEHTAITNDAATKMREIANSGTTVITSNNFMADPTKVDLMSLPSADQIFYLEKDPEKRAAIENKITGEIYAVDPTVNDYLYIDFITYYK